MASACLPRLFQAVTIDGVPYWDGGFAGNPPLWPLFYETQCRDAIIVQINPIERDRTPRTAQEIADRMNEITFNAGLIAELRAADFVARLIDRGVLKTTATGARTCIASAATANWKATAPPRRWTSPGPS